MSIHNLIYLSAASKLFSSQELVDILDKSRINNSRLSVTGLLLYNDGSILQILEGEEVVIRQLFNKIMLDNRHNGIITLIDCSIKERSFQDWSMGFKQVSSENWNKLDGYLNLADKEVLNKVTSTRSNEIITLIKSFANVNML